MVFNISKKTGKQPKIIDGESKEIKDDKNE